MCDDRQLELQSESRIDDQGDLVLTITLLIDDMVVSETTEYIDIKYLLERNDR